MSDNWRWYGHVGHLCVGNWCRFHLTTHVGHFMVSTLGEYVPDEQVREILANCRNLHLEGVGDARLYDWLDKAGYEKIGARRIYETMVFPAGKPCQTRDCGCGLPEILHPNVDFEGYLTPSAATLGHYALCEKWEHKDEELDTRTGEEAREEFHEAVDELGAAHMDMLDAIPDDDEEEVTRDLSQDLPEELKQALRDAEFDAGDVDTGRDG